jgi:hypothetical protein
MILFLFFIYFGSLILNKSVICLLILSLFILHFIQLFEFFYFQNLNFINLIIYAFLYLHHLKLMIKSIDLKHLEIISLDKLIKNIYNYVKL